MRARAGDSFIAVKQLRFADERAVRETIHGRIKPLFEVLQASTSRPSTSLTMAAWRVD